jgi:3-hydroxyacyl-CoA dehydrogenase / enoyl-CoA hydratase / 3-hydroxybutyryl-CoA epimerase
MIGTQIVEGVAVLTWDMPGRSQNVFNRESLAAFSDVLEAAIADEGVVGLVVTSAKKDYIAGADLDTIEEMCRPGKTAAELAEGAGALGDLLRRMETCGKPVAAAINGHALGGGFELCLAAHHRVLHPRAKVGLPESTLGLLPGAGGTQRLPRMIGVQASMPLLLEGKQVRAEKALKLGLVDALSEDVVDTACAWVRSDAASSVKPWDKKGFTIPGGGFENPRTASTFMVANAMFREKTFGNYPAGRAVMSCLFEGLRLPLDPALKIEQRYFVSLLVDPTAGAMVRTLFLALQRANKLARRPEGVEKRRPSKVGVIGAGLMGAGIAYCTAKAGIDVVLLDLTQEGADKGKEYIRTAEDKRISRKRSTEEKRDAILARVHPVCDYAALEGCQVVVEAVFEDRGVKAKVTQAAEAVIARDAVFGSNTSTLPITGLSEGSTRPENYIGMHFFSPAEKMPLVEVIVGEKTSDACLAWTLDYVQAIGKTPIVVNDARGFYTSRVFGTYITEGLVMLQEGIAPALIENAGKATGMPMPPLQLADEVGLALMVQVGKQTRADLGDAAPDNPSQPILENIVDSGRTGKRGGAGFYSYGDDRRLWSGLSELFPRAETQPSVDELKQRFLFTQCLEAARIMEDGVLRSAEDADVGAIMGWGFSPWTGGPLSYIDRFGAGEFAALARTLEAAYGERFAPPALLDQMASEGRSFHG